MLLKTSISLWNSSVLEIQGSANDQEMPILTSAGKAASLIIWASKWSCSKLHDFPIFPDHQNDQRSHRLSLLPAVSPWKEVCIKRRKRLLCYVLRQPVCQPLWGVQETHRVRFQGTDLAFTFLFFTKLYTNLIALMGEAVSSPLPIPVLVKRSQHSHRASAHGREKQSWFPRIRKLQDQRLGNLRIHIPQTHTLTTWCMRTTTKLHPSPPVTHRLQSLRSAWGNCRVLL